MIDYLLSARLLLDMAAEGDRMRAVIGRVVQALAVAVGFALVLSWGGLWTTIGTLGMWGALALTFSQIIFLAASAKIVQIIYVRGEDILALPDSDFTMMSVFATLVRLPGETALAFFALMSLPVMLLVFGGAGHIVGLFGVPVLTAHWAIAGIVAMITCWVIGFASFVAFALAAEMVSAFYTIAHDLRCARRHLEAADPHDAHASMSPRQHAA